MDAFIFDIGNVLIHFDFSKLVETISVNSKLTTSEIKQIWNGPELVRVETGKINEKIYFRNFSEMVGIKWTYRDWLEAWMDSYMINETGIGLLRKLRKNNYPVYVLSNLAKYNVEAINIKFPGFFKEAKNNFFSYELGYHKPDPKIYQEVCFRIAVSPSRCVFLDDVKDNVDGAISIGMNGFVYSNDRIEQIIEQIEAIIIESSALMQVMTGNNRNSRN